MWCMADGRTVKTPHYRPMSKIWGSRFLGFSSFNTLLWRQFSIFLNGFRSGDVHWSWKQHCAILELKPKRQGQYNRKRSKFKYHNNSTYIHDYFSLLFLYFSMLNSPSFGIWPMVVRPKFPIIAQGRKFRVISCNYRCKYSDRIKGARVCNLWLSCFL